MRGERSSQQLISVKGGLDSLRGWNQARKHLNHQALKNQFLGSLEPTLSDTSQRTAEHIQQEIEWMRSTWNWLGPEAMELLDGYEKSCSPVHLLDDTIMGHLDPNMGKEIERAVHEDWVIRRGIREWVCRGKALAGEIGAIIDDPNLNPTTVETLGPRILDRCRQLCAHLQQYPTLHCPI